MVKDVETQLKELILDEDFASLQNLANKEVNLMDILRVSNRELAHSNFLAWMFNPSESHNLGDFAIKEFIKIYFLGNQFQNLGNESGLSVFDFVQMDFSDIDIRREYKKYKSAFDLVYKYSGPANFNEIANIIQDLIKNEKTIRPFYSNNTYVRFQPNFLYENLESLINSGLVSESDDLTNNWEYLFEFNVRNHQVMFDFKIGEGDQLIREKLYGIYSKYPEIFNKVIRASGRLSGKWHLAFQRQILSKSEIEKYFTDENYDIRGVLSRKFEDLINNDLPKIIKCINAEL